MISLFLGRWDFSGRVVWWGQVVFFLSNFYIVFAIGLCFGLAILISVILSRGVCFGYDGGGW